MVYRPCSANNPNTPYMVASALGHSLTYLKHFLKLFYSTTVVHKDSYPQYRRRDNLQSQPVCIPGRNSTTVNLNNHYIILYNPYLSAKYYAYINIKVYTSIKAIKYINKYIYKGDDRTTVQLLDNNNEISKYLYGRYIGPTKAV